MTRTNPDRPAREPSDAARGLHFFLSYARSDDDAYIEQFYRDLCGEVRVRAGLPSAAEVGFLDTHSIEIGAAWSVEVVDALSRSCSFVALCSPRYFVSEPCGREWQVFSERTKQYERTTGRRSTALIPAIWLPPRRVPDAVRQLQYKTDAFGDAYRRHGLRQLMRLHRNRDEYLESLAILADRIVENELTVQLPPMPDRQRVKLHRVPSAFHAGHQAAARTGREPPTVGSDHVHFMVAAPSRREASTVRRNVGFYGDGALDWAPYRPSLPDPLADFARDIAAKRGLTADVSPVPVSGPSIAAQTTGKRIVVLLVDAWATQLDAYRQALAEHEVAPDAAATAMIPRSHEDGETDDNWRQLSDALRSVFLNRVAAGEALSYRADILSHRAFDEDLQIVLEVARNRLFSRGPAPEKVTAPRRKRPILEGP